MGARADSSVDLGALSFDQRGKLRSDYFRSFRPGRFFRMQRDHDSRRHDTKGGRFSAIQCTGADQI